MNRQAIGAVGELIGGIAVVVSLVYLAIQIRQNTRQIQENITAVRLARRDEMQQLFSRFRHLVSTPENRDLYLQGCQDYDALARPERFHFGLLLQEFLFCYEAMFLNLQEDVYPRDAWDHGQSKLLNAVLSQPGVQTWWERNSLMFLPEFVAEIDRLENREGAVQPGDEADRP
jgi:hypothetical protein